MIILKEPIVNVTFSLLVILFAICAFLVLASSSPRKRRVTLQCGPTRKYLLEQIIV